MLDTDQQVLKTWLTCFRGNMRSERRHDGGSETSFSDRGRLALPCLADSWLGLDALYRLLQKGLIQPAAKMTRQHRGYVTLRLTQLHRHIDTVKQQARSAQKSIAMW